LYNAQDPFHRTFLSDCRHFEVRSNRDFDSSRFSNTSESGFCTSFIRNKSSIDKMEFQDAQKFVVRSVNEITSTFQKVPGSAMLIRYIQSSYQDDPVRSAIELVLVIFFIRYLLSPSYATHTGNFVKLTEEVSLHQQCG